MFSLFQIRLRDLLKNKILLYKHYNLNDQTIYDWPFWMFEENIKIINEINDEEDKTRKSQEKEQNKQAGNASPNSYMKGMGDIAGKFKR